MTFEADRRSFLKGAASGAALLLVGVGTNGALAAAGRDAQLNPFVKIGDDGKVIAIIKHFEMGQGPSTGLSTLIAEEIGLRMDQIDFEFAPAQPQHYGNFFFGEFQGMKIQGTGGSTAMANSFMQYRMAGAAAREMLIAAAAQEWAVGAADIDIVEGVITGAGRTAPLGDFVAAAAQMAAPAEPRLKRPEDWRLIGNPDLRRLDSPAKTNGTARFAMDVHLPNQMVAVIARSPRMGGRVDNFDATAAQSVKGFIQALPLPTQTGIVVYAESTWQAFQAREALEITWDYSKAENRGSDQVKMEIVSALNADPDHNVNNTDKAAVDDAMANAAKVVEEMFYFPLLAHAPMEPLTCTIEANTDGGVTLHDGCQSPSAPMFAFAQIFKLPFEKIRINTMFAGGSFGRRGTQLADYQVEAALAFVMTDRSRPVKLVWSREDDLRSGSYRPAFGHKVRVGLDARGDIVAWDHRIAGQSIYRDTPLAATRVIDGVDRTSVEGVADSLYRIPGMFVGLTDTKKATEVIWWRSVGHTHTGHVMEVMMDRAARAAGRDPVDFRLDYLRDGEDQMRKAAVLRLAAEKGNWGRAPHGRSQGIAVHKSFGTYVAELVEVSGDASSGIKIEKVTCAVDCGIPVNPDIIRAQIESGVGYGIGHAMRNEITLTDGEVDQQNFPDYAPLRIGDIGTISVHIVPSTQAPTGVGEPGTPPSAPALVNAVFATGHAVASLPMNKDGVVFA